MNIVWLDLNSSYSHSSLALPAIHAQCDNTHNWDVVKTTINISVGNIIEEVITKKPDIILATAWLFTIEHLFAVLNRIHVLLPKTIIALGGPEFLGNNEHFLRDYSFIDIIFRGEGEESVPQWLKIVENKGNWGTIEGICYINSEGNYIDNGNAKVKDFCKLNAPENSRFFCSDKAFVQFETARGCFNTCAFCVSGADKPVRTLPLPILKERLDKYLTMGIKSIRLLDRTFNGQSKRALTMLDLFYSYRDKLTFHLEVHPAYLSEEIRKKLKEAPKGLLHLEAGIQSLHEDVLKRSQRLGSLVDSLDGLAFLCSLNNIITHADLIAGLPGYSYEMIVKDIHQLASLGTDEIQLESLKLLPGTQMREHAVEKGLIYSPQPPYEILQSDMMDVFDLQKAQRLSRLIDMYYNTDFWQEVFKKLMLSNTLFLGRFLDYMETKDVLLQPLSIEKRGLFLYDFVENYYPDYLNEISNAWILGGLSMNKKPAQEMKPLHLLPSEFIILKGNITPTMRFYQVRDQIFGYERSLERQKPIFWGKL